MSRSGNALFRSFLMTGKKPKNSGPATDGDYIRYLINRENMIESVNDEWYSFAEQNSGNGLIVHETVLCRDISSFIACGKCRELYDMLIKNVRANRKAVDFSFRCDSPEKRRYMHMEMVPLEQGKIEFTSYLEREEDRTPVALLEIFVERSEEIVTICSWCKRIKAKDETWLEAEEAVETMSLFNRSQLPKLSHGICSACCECLMKKIR